MDNSRGIDVLTIPTFWENHEARIANSSHGDISDDAKRINVPPKKFCKEFATDPSKITSYLPKNVKVSGNGLILFTKDSCNDLLIFSPHTNKETVILNIEDLKSSGILNEAEKQKEEARRNWSSGFSNYDWLGDDDDKIYTTQPGGRIVVINVSDLENITFEEITCGDGACEIRPSPDGKYIAFVKESNLFVMNLISKKVKQITYDGSNTIKNGLAEFIALEEMDRYEGYWWSEDSSMIAFTKFDESVVDEISRLEIDDSGKTKVINWRYPYPGCANVKISLYITKIVEDFTKDFRIDEVPTTSAIGSEDIYLPRVRWQGDILIYMLQSRDQKTVEIYASFYSEGDLYYKLIVTRRTDKYFNLPNENDFHLMYSQYLERYLFICTDEVDSGYKALQFVLFDPQTKGAKSEDIKLFNSFCLIHRLRERSLKI